MKHLIIFGKRFKSTEELMEFVDSNPNIQIQERGNACGNEPIKMYRVPKEPFGFITYENWSLLTKEIDEHEPNDDIDRLNEDICEIAHIATSPNPTTGQLYPPLKRYFDYKDR